MTDTITLALAVFAAAAFGFMFAAMLGANARERDARRAYDRGRHPAGRDLPSNVRSIPMTWDDAR